ncbi:hypothetical protein HDV63DRAFT_403074 [Trichoderma sp. SZMC 28014]
MSGLSRALALLAFGTAVRASPFFASNGTITAPPTSTTASSTGLAIANVTCGTQSDFPAFILQEYQGLSTSHDLQCQCLEQAFSWLETTVSPTRTLTRTIGTGVTTFTETITSGSTTTTSVVTTVVNTVATATVTGNFIDGQTNVWYGSASSPCCYSCTIAASTVEVFYWADATTTSSGFAQVTSFVSNGYTFQSPSIYIGFSSLSAFDYCGVVGQPFTNITVGFDPDELSTIVFSASGFQTDTDVDTATNGGVFTTTDTVTFYTPVGSAALNTKDLERNCSTIVGYNYVPGNPSNAVDSSPDPCHPTIVIPDRVRSLDPAWASCISDAFGGFYDPPSALSSVTALVATSAPPATTTTAASPPRTSNTQPTSTPPPPPPKTSSSAAPPPPPPSSSSNAPPPPSSSSNAPPPPPPSSSSNAPPPPPPSSSSQGAGGSSAGSPPASSSSVGGNNPPPPASSSNGAGSGGSGTSASSPSGTPGGSNNGGGSSGGNSGGNGGNGGNGNGGNGGGNGGSSGGGNNSGNGSGSGSPPNGSNDNSSGGNGGSNGSGSNGSGSNGSGSNGSGSNGNGGNGSGNNGGGAADSSSTPQNTGTGAPPTSVISVGSVAFTENSQSQFVHGSTTLIPGGPAVTVGGNTLSLPTSGSEIIVNGSTEPVSEAASATSGSESSAAGETGAPGSQETSAGSSGTSGSTNTASSGLPSSSIPPVPKSGASGLGSGVMTNIQIVVAVMLVAFYI